MAHSKEPFPYEDIINLSRPESPGRVKMPGRNRAAQFSPFAALSGYSEVIAEVGRLTQERRYLTEEETEKLGRRLFFLSRHNTPPQEITVTYFHPDPRKPGGAYRTVTGTVKKIDAYRKTVILSSGLSIPMGEIFSLEGAVFDALEDAGADW